MSRQIDLYMGIHKGQRGKLFDIARKAGRIVSFSHISGEENMADIKLKGYSCDKETTNIERKILSDVKDKDYQRSKHT